MKKLNSSSLFVWHKKIEKKKKKIATECETTEKKKRLLREEFQKLKKKREESIANRSIILLQKSSQREEEEEEIISSSCSSLNQNVNLMNSDLEKREKDFEFHQIKLRAEIRLREGRPKVIDKLLFIIIHHPQHNTNFHYIEEIIEGLKTLIKEEFEQLYEQIKLLIELDTPTHKRYWEALLVICECQQKEQPRGLHSSIEVDVKNLLQSKTYLELEELQTDIDSQMRSGAAKVVEYWEAVVKHLRFYKAMAFIKEGICLCDAAGRRMNVVRALSLEPTLCKQDINPQPQATQEEEQGAAAGSHSPQLLHCHDEYEVHDPREDKAILERKRIAVMKEQESKADVVYLDSKVYWWHDKYRPRKPKYYNSVHTGHGWNRYNRVHYDCDNPPPKMVLGYKFNILYPDRLEKTTAPVFTAEEDGESPDTCILRFHAGPPYEDIAFRIVNKEWEYSRKKGFKCTFERGILQLHFNFKRCGYRR